MALDEMIICNRSSKENIEKLRSQINVSMEHIRHENSHQKAAPRLEYMLKQVNAFCEEHVKSLGDCIARTMEGSTHKLLENQQFKDDISHHMSSIHAPFVNSLVTATDLARFREVSTVDFAMYIDQYKTYLSHANHAEKMITSLGKVCEMHNKAAAMRESVVEAPLDQEAQPAQLSDTDKAAFFSNCASVADRVGDGPDLFVSEKVVKAWDVFKQNNRMEDLCFEKLDM